MGGTMGEDSQVTAPARYRAFISYSHADTRFAGWLHRKLETWSPPGQTRLAPIFIDRAELAAGPDLSAQVREALAGSAALIVVASPTARTSRWVAQEISLFRELHPDRPVLAALLQGEPIAAFPNPLLNHGGDALEPLAADFRDGHDGKRLALLKIVAGLTAQPLDQLVQRDAQNRQRRVMVVTAGAVLLSLVLAAALIVALRARTEAEHQRAEAEGMVEFMLTDLRDKLKGVGRLDIMDTVNEQAMAYYGGQHSLTQLSPDSLDRRARVIEAMGEDDENRGDTDAAFAKYSELHRTTKALWARDKSNPDRVYAMAMSENRLALTETSRGHIGPAFERFRSAAQMLERLPTKRTRPHWQALRSLVAGNLCAIALKARGNAQEAVDNCTRAITLAQAQLTVDPEHSAARYDLTFHYLWLGEAWQAAAQPAKAGEARDRGLALSTALIARDPKNMQWREQHMEVCFSLARIARTQGDTSKARALAKLAQHDIGLLAPHDPANRYWADYQTRINQFSTETSK
jgi:tetratricopeptide (TPR) repeat protein